MQLQKRLAALAEEAGGKKICLTIKVHPGIPRPPALTLAYPLTLALTALTLISTPGEDMAIALDKAQDASTLVVDAYAFTNPVAALRYKDLAP